MSRRSKNFEINELIRRKTSMGSEIASKDKDYANYSGGDLETVLKMARIDVFLKYDLLPNEVKTIVKLQRSYLDQKRKAFFCSVGTDVFTKLAFILGDTRKVVNATGTD